MEGAYSCRDIWVSSPPEPMVYGVGTIDNASVLFPIITIVQSTSQHLKVVEIEL